MSFHPKSASIILTFILSITLYTEWLTIDGKSVIDLGTFPAQEGRAHTFRLFNSSQRKITIQKIRSTCGCLIGHLSASEVAPGETLEIQTEIRPDSVSGEFSKSIYVETDQPSRRFIRLELKGTAQPLLEIRPAAQFYAGKLKADREYEFRFELLPSRSGIELATPANSDCRLERQKDRWLAFCRLTPSGQEKIVEKTFRIEVISPAARPPLSIHIRGVLEEP